MRTAKRRKLVFIWDSTAILPVARRAVVSVRLRECASKTGRGLVRHTECRVRHPAQCTRVRLTRGSMVRKQWDSVVEHGCSPVRPNRSSVDRPTRSSVEKPTRSSVEWFLHARGTLRAMDTLGASCSWRSCGFLLLEWAFLFLVICVRHCSLRRPELAYTRTVSQTRIWGRRRSSAQGGSMRR
jgi:hypothetical protein